MAVSFNTPERVFKTSCRHCHCECGVLVTVKEGRVTKIKGDPDNPVTKGYICSKGVATKELIYHPERIKYPIKRTSNGWQRISWDEALDIVTDKLQHYKQKYGAESVCFLHGTARGGWFTFFVRLANAFGSPNWGEPGWAQCFMPRLMSSILTCGSGVMECPDFEHTKCIMIWGANPAATWPAKWKKIRDSLRRGSKLIVIDPVETEAVKRADLWLQLRPATDAALALGILHVLIFDNLYNKKFVDEWTIGFNYLRDRVKEYTPEVVSKITWVSSESIRKAAYMMAEYSPSSIFQCVAIDQNNNTIQTSRAICLIQVLTGNIDNPGGNLIPMTAGHVNVWGKDEALPEALSTGQRLKRLGAEKYRLLGGEQGLLGGSAHIPTVWQAILTSKPYPVKAGLIFGSNAAVSWANSNEVEAALKNLEFKVVVDLFMTKTAKMADLILPVTSWLETNDIVDSLQATYGDIYVRQKVVNTPECWTDREIILALAKRLGLEEYFPWETEEEYLDYILKPIGLTFKQFKEKVVVKVPISYYKYAKNGFNTPSGKIEIYSSLLKRLSYDPLPYYEEPSESPYSNPDLAKKYPFILTTGGRVIYYRHTEMRNIPSLRKNAPEPLADLNPITAKELSIRDGDYIIVESPRGSIEIKARLTEGIHPRVIQICPGWEGKANVNYLTDNKNCSPIVGTTPLRGLLCNIKKL